MEEEDKQYIKGFNSGYFISKYDPGLTTKLRASLQPASSYLTGFLAGSLEFEKEKGKSPLNEIRNIRSKSKDDRDINRDL